MKMSLIISQKKVLRVLIYILALLFILAVLSQLYKYMVINGQDSYLIRIFDMDVEKNFPTFFNSLILLLCSFLLFIISAAKRKLRDPFLQHWFFLSIFFFLMSADEIISLHEQLISPIRNALNTGGFLYFAWVIPAFVFAVLFLLAYLKFIISLNRKSRILFITSGLVYGFGAMGFEIISGKFVVEFGKNNLAYSFVTTAEETLEMIGLILFIYALLNYMSTQFPEICISFFEKNKIE